MRQRFDGESQRIRLHAVQGALPLHGVSRALRLLQVLLMRTHVAFAANSGITPALALVNRVMSESPQDRVWIFYGHRAGDHEDGLDQLLSLKDRYLDRVALGVVTERESDEAELLSGTLDGAKVRSLSSRLFDARAIERYFVFGPDSLATEVTTALDGLGVDRARIQVEQAHDATARATAGASPGQQETQVSFVMDGRRRAFSM